MKLKKQLYYTVFSLFLFSVFFFCFPKISYSAYPKIVSTIITAFESIKTWIIRIATPAAAVAVRHRRVYEKVQFWR